MELAKYKACICEGFAEEAIAVFGKAPAQELEAAAGLHRRGEKAQVRPCAAGRCLSKEPAENAWRAIAAIRYEENAVARKAYEKRYQKAQKEVQLLGDGPLRRASAL